MSKERYRHRSDARIAERKRVFTVTFDNDEAEMCLVNTCSFIGDARKESVRTLVELAGQGKELIIAGCLAQHFKEELLNEIPEARAVVGTGDIAKIVDVITQVAKDSSLRVVQVSDIPNDYHEDVLTSHADRSRRIGIFEDCRRM